MLSKTFTLLLSFSFFLSFGQFSREDSLRGSITPQRAWWDLTFYELNVRVDPFKKEIKGSNTVHFKALSTLKEMQIDLQEPLKITSVLQEGKACAFRKVSKNAYFIAVQNESPVTINFSGSPTVANRPPWDGGIVWTQDAAGNPWISTACQGIGSSVWWPCKDHMYDEPDSMRVRVTAPNGLMQVGNGKLEENYLQEDGSRTTTWMVRNPINNYAINLNIGNYVYWQDTYAGEKGPLDLSFYVLPENLEKAKIHFQDAYRTLEALEYWFGPYPFYEDGYKLVEAPYLGMEHQSAVTYGNGYTNGYRGRSLSSSEYGMKWDFIIVHESGHEWFANNITYKDIADMWIHESFTNYSECLFTEYFYGKEAGAEYVIGTRKNIQNDIPIIGIYHFNKRGSGDMYYKGGNLLHTIRHIINEDEIWRSILRGLNKDFYHQTVNTEQIENYISNKSGIDLSKVFDQYLRNTAIPKLVIKKEGKKLCYRWENCIPNFHMPVDIYIDGNKVRLEATTSWKKVKGSQWKEDINYYIQAEEI